MSVSPTPAPNKAAMLGLALLLPALISLGHTLASHTTLPGIAGGNRPALAFDQYLINLGQPEPRALHQVNFHFDNRSTRPVTITEVKPSCGCLAPKIVNLSQQKQAVEAKQFSPGDHGALILGIRPAKESPGEKSYSVAISYNDGQPRTEILEFRITLPKKKLTIEPNELYFYQVSGEPDSRTVTVTDFRDQPVKINSVQAITEGSKETAKPFDGVNVTLGDMSRGSEGEALWPIQVDVAPHMPAGRHQGWIVISTSDTENPHVKIPFVLFGQEQATAGKDAGRSQFYGPTPKTASGTEAVIK